MQTDSNPRLCAVPIAKATQKLHQRFTKEPSHVKAVRDNGRLSVEDSEFARHLWQASSLNTIFADISLGPRRAVGLNANIRLYRQELSAWDTALSVRGAVWTVPVRIARSSPTW